MKIVATMTAIAAVTLASQAHANVGVRFVESAPKDRFEISNTGECALENLVVAIDLGDSAGGLVFDTTGSGAGVEVFQPFERRSGALTLVSSAAVKDGDTALAVRIDSLAAGESASFTIDVDDTLRNSALGQIRVAGAEIEGATVQIQQGDTLSTAAQFGDNSRTQVTINGC